MNFLKKIFGGGQSGDSNDRAGMYFYVRPTGCDEIVRVRVDLNNDLSYTDEGDSLWVHKLARGTSYKCRSVEMDLYFDTNRRLQNSDLKGGELVTQADYEAWITSKN
jgi:hypothetical protein